MKVEKTSLEGVLLIKSEPFDEKNREGELFEDERGYFLETYNKSKYADNGIDVDFVEDDISISRKNVLRGIHGNNETWKLVSCAHGGVYFVAVNCDKESPLFGRWEGFNLDDENNWKVLVPPKYGSAYLALTDKVVFQYKQSTYYNPKTQFAYAWNDPTFNIKWPIDNPILSNRDTGAK